MSDFKRVRDFSYQDIASAINEGTLEMALGPFTTQVSGKAKQLHDFFYDAYRDVPVRLQLEDVTDVSINVKPPSILRTYIRRQVVPDPGFQVPAVPLPHKLAALSFEMGLNLAIALKNCRFVTFHSGVVAGENGSILMSAASGGGKSTLVSALMEEGFRLLSDEFGILDPETGSLFPYPRPVSLKAGSIPIVNDFAGADWLTPTLTGTPKGDIAYRRARPEDISGMAEPSKARLILFPSFAAGVKPSARRMAKSETIMRLIPSSTNYHLLGEDAFNALTDMVAGAETYELIYGSTEESIMMVRDLAVKAGV